MLQQVPSLLAERYRVERELGAGGMATVYLARDLKHDRDVAIKVLHPDLGATLGGERFLSEIKTTAKLQHPHILPLLDSGEAEGLLYYVMPLVAGETLRARLAREKQLPIDDALRVAREVADALQYAHTAGVIHRDIKPENVLLQGGHALVADFGIALAVEQAGGQRMTQTGLSLGTPQYMSPEQAAGEKRIDARSDIYSLGAVTYEMLTGEPPFTGPTVQAIVAKVMGTEPERPTLIRKTIPASVERAVLKALAKLPADRFATAMEFATSLSDDKSAANGSGAGFGRSSASPGLRYAAVAAGAAAVTFAIAFVVIPRNGGAPATFDIGLPDTAQMSFPSRVSEFSISPREDFVVYTVRRRDSTSIWRRDLAHASANALTGTQGGVAPRISPDGRFVAFVTTEGIRVVPTEGGSARSLAEVADVVALEWISPRELFVVDHDGNRVRFIDRESGQLSERNIGYCIEPHWLAETKQFLCGGGGQKHGFLLGPNAKDTFDIHLRTAQTDTRARLAGTDFRLVDGRYLVYMSLDGDLRAAAYDPASHTAERSVTLVTGVRREPYTGAGQYRITPTGTLMYALGPNAEVGRLVKLSRGKPPVPLPIEPAAFLRWDETRDGKRLAASVPTADGMELRIYDLASGRMTVWLRAHDVGQPVWSPSGERLIIDVADSSGSAILGGSPKSGQPPDTLTRLHFRQRQFEPHHYPSEHVVVLNAWDIDLIETFDPTAKSFRVDTIATGARFGALSPDGRFVAYQSTKTGEIVVLNRQSKRKVQIAPTGSEPLWLSPNELIFRDTPGWYVAKLDPQTGDVIGNLDLWPMDPRFSDTPGYSNRLSSDGGIIYEQSPEPLVSPYIRVIPHWVDEMKRRVRDSR